VALKHARAGEPVDLSPLGTRLQEARTEAIVKSSSFEAVRLVVHAGRVIPTHKVPGQITLHCLEGRVELGIDDSSLELGPNEWVYLDGGEPHSVRGIEDSSLLLTILLVT
jgi:quercetin dioxygenase-like cupin family protein